MILYCLIEVYPLPQPGRSATKGSVVIKGQSAVLTMDTTYPVSSFFRVCSLTTNICCPCQGLNMSNCEFGDLSSINDHEYVSCKLITSQADLYQFQILAYNYPCYFDIGDPIKVNDDSNSDGEFSFHILSYSLGGVCILLVFGIIGTFCVTRKVYKRRYYARLGVLYLAIYFTKAM